MDAGLWVQYVLVGLAVLASAVFVLRRQFPGAVRRLRTAVALPLLQPASPFWLRRLGRRIAPPPPARGDACGGCGPGGGCGPH